MWKTSKETDKIQYKRIKREQSYTLTGAGNFSTTVKGFRPTKDKSSTVVTGVVHKIK